MLTKTKNKNSSFLKVHLKRLFSLTSPVAHSNVQLANVVPVQLRNDNLSVKFAVRHRGVKLLKVHRRPKVAVTAAKVRRALVVDSEKLSGGQLKALHRVNRPTEDGPLSTTVARVVAHLVAVKKR